MNPRFEKLEVVYIVNKRGDNYNLALYEREINSFNMPMRKVFEKVYNESEFNRALMNCHARGIYNYNAIFILIIFISE